MTQKTKNAPLLKKCGILELFCGIMEKFHFFFLFEGFPYCGKIFDFDQFIRNADLFILMETKPCCYIYI